MAELKTSSELVEDQGGPLFEKGPSVDRVMRRLVDKACAHSWAAPNSRGERARRNMERFYQGAPAANLQFHQQPGSLLQREMEHMTQEERGMLSDLRSEDVGDLDFEARSSLDDTHYYGTLKTRRTVFPIRLHDEE